MKNFEIATVGDNCIDRYLAPTALATVGGNAVNVAVQLSRLGRRAAYFGAVGTDKAGAWIRASLQENQVGIAGLRVDDGRTAYTNLDIDPSGDRVIAFEDFGVCRGYTPSDSEVRRLLSAKHIHLGWLDDGGALKRNLAAGAASISQDLAVNAGAGNLSIAFASAGAAPDEARKLMRQALDQGAQIAVVTRGSLGSIASDGTRYAETGIVGVDVVDTTGAGDTFIAAFIDAHVHKRDLGECLEAGRDAAANTCCHLGGFPQVPVALAELSAGD